jgi:hypothetical protein
MEAAVSRKGFPNPKARRHAGGGDRVRGPSAAMKRTPPPRPPPEKRPGTEGGPCGVVGCPERGIVSLNGGAWVCIDHFGQQMSGVGARIRAALAAAEGKATP